MPNFRSIRGQRRINLGRRVHAVNGCRWRRFLGSHAVPAGAGRRPECPKQRGQVGARLCETQILERPTVRADHRGANGGWKLARKNRPQVVKCLIDDCARDFVALLLSCIAASPVAKPIYERRPVVAFCVATTM